METLIQDVHFGLRMLRKNPGFTSVAVLTLALGIGANTAIFSMVNSILLQPLPVKNPEQIVVINSISKKNWETQFSIPDFRDIRSETGNSFSGLFGSFLGLDGLSLNGTANADVITTFYVTGDFFSVLEIRPALGRLILPSEGGNPGEDSVLVLGYSYWKTRFGGDPHVIGRQVSINGRPSTIIGVAPEGFNGGQPSGASVAIGGYLPLSMLTLETFIPSDFMTNHSTHPLSVMGRLQPGVTLAQAQASLTVVSKRLSEEYPNTDRDLNLRVFPELRMRAGDPRKNTVTLISGLFLGLAALVLLLACLNVANILLVRATIRQREMAIRAALGGTRVRLVRQLLTESLMLAFGGGVAGLVFGRWTTSAMSLMNLRTSLPLKIGFDLDWRVFAYALSAAAATGLLVGIVPAIRVSRANPGNILHEGGRSMTGMRQRLRNALVIAQVGGSLTLLIIAGLFIRSLNAAQQADLGFDPKHVLNMSLDPNYAGYTEAQAREFHRNLLDRVRALPGVISASTGFSVPMGYTGVGENLTIDGYQPPPEQSHPSSSYNVVSTDYFKTMGIAIIRGRTFADSDDEKAQHVAIVNEAFAKRYWPGQDPIGRQFKLESDNLHSVQVIAIAKDAHFQGENIKGSVDPFFYIPFVQHYFSQQTLQIRTAGPPEAMIPEVERIISSMAPDLPIVDVQTMVQALYTLNGLLIFQIGAALAVSLGLLGLVLAVIGVYGVISYAVSQRTQEIGIRMALGAQPVDIFKMIFHQGIIIVSAGLIVGLVAAFAVARLVRNFIVVNAMDPATYLMVSAGLVLVALIACYIPARRATRVDPMVALRHE